MLSDSPKWGDTGIELFVELPSPFSMVRYHSLASTDWPSMEIFVPTRHTIAKATQLSVSARMKNNCSETLECE